MANLLRHEDSVFWILRKSNQSLLGFILLLVPYALSMQFRLDLRLHSHIQSASGHPAGKSGIEFS